MIRNDEFEQLCLFYPILRTLSNGQQEALKQESQRFNARDEQILFDIEGSCAAFVMVTNGAIRVSKPTLNGREILLYRVRPGDSCILTVSCLLGHAHYPARGTAEEMLLGYTLPRSLFTQFLDQSTSFREFIFQFFAERIVHLTALVQDVAFRSMEQRLAALLLSKGMQIETTHQTLADEMGTVREVVSRHLKDFEGRGWLQLERGLIRILQPNALRQLASDLA